jgi:hypothetical protein
LFVCLFLFFWGDCLWRNPPHKAKVIFLIRDRSA